MLYVYFMHEIKVLHTFGYFYFILIGWFKLAVFTFFNQYILSAECFMLFIIIGNVHQLIRNCQILDILRYYMILVLLL